MNPRLKARVQEADLVLLIGGLLGELPSQGYTLLEVPQPSQKFIHVHPGAEELGKVYKPTLAIHASPVGLARAIERSAVTGADHGEWLREVRAEYLAWTTEPPEHPGTMQMGAVIRTLEKMLPRDAIITTGAGNYAGWINRFYRFNAGTDFVAPTSGSMGYGVPAAIAAKIIEPHRTVVAFAGDGCFLMTGQEFATAVLHNAAVVIVVVNNGMYGTIRMHQEREYPGRVVATSLANPDFADYARAFGGHGESVRHTEEFAPAMERALASGKPAIVELHLDPEAISTTSTLSSLRQQAQRKPT